MNWIILFIIGLVSILPMRLIQINGTTSETFNALYAVVTIIIILCFIVPLLVKKITIKQSESFKNTISGGFALVLSVLFLVDGLYSLTEHMKNNTISVAVFLVFLFEILTAFFFLLYMFPYHFKMKKTPTYFVLSSLFPVIWLAAHMLNVFLQSTTGISVSQHSFTILADAFALLFFFSQARVLAKIEYQKGQRGMLLYGYLSSLFLLITTISNFVYTNQIFDALSKGKTIPNYLVEGTNQQITLQDRTLVTIELCIGLALCLYILSVTLFKNFSNNTELNETEVEYIEEPADTDETTIDDVSESNNKEDEKE